MNETSVLPKAIAVCFCCLNSENPFFEVLKKKNCFWESDVEQRVRSRPRNNPMRGFRTHVPRLFDIAVLCMSIYPTGVLHRATEDKEWSGRVIKKRRRCIGCSLIVYSWFPTSAHRAVSPRVALILTRSDPNETRGLNEMSFTCSDPQQEPQSRFACHQNGSKPTHLLT